MIGNLLLVGPTATSLIIIFGGGGDANDVTFSLIVLDDFECFFCVIKPKSNEDEAPNVGAVVVIGLLLVGPSLSFGPRALVGDVVLDDGTERFEVELDSF